MDDHHFLLMELCPRSLHNVLSTCRMENKFLGISWRDNLLFNRHHTESDDFIQWSEGLTSGLIFLGEMGFSHGDIKPEKLNFVLCWSKYIFFSLLIGTDNQLKITDFGLSSRMDLANHYSITEKKVHETLLFFIFIFYLWENQSKLNKFNSGNCSLHGPRETQRLRDEYRCNVRCEFAIHITA